MEYTVQWTLMPCRHVSSGIILKTFTFVKKKDKLQSICSIKPKRWNIEKSARILKIITLNLKKKRNQKHF